MFSRERTSGFISSLLDSLNAKDYLRKLVVLMSNTRIVNSLKEHVYSKSSVKEREERQFALEAVNPVDKCLI